MAVRRTVTLSLIAGLLGASTAGAAAVTGPPKPKIVIGVDGVEAKTGRTTVTGTFFDLSDSVAVKGTRLVSATLRFGDKTKPRAFKGKSVNWQVNHVYPHTGAYTVTVTLKQSNGVTGTRQERVTVYDPPAVTVSGPTASVSVGQPVTVTIATATPAGTHLRDYAYSWGDSGAVKNVKGAPPSTLTHVFTKTGTFVFGLAVDNDANGNATGSWAVTVHS